MDWKKESIFKHSVRAFFVSLFGVIGALVALVALVMFIGALANASDDEKFSTNIKILPDADGHRKQLGSSAPVILQLNIKGTIGLEEVTGKKVREILLESREDKLKDDRVKGILISIDSPGGGVTDSDIIYRLLKEYKRRYEIPVYAFVDGTCASGGYYIACAADQIYASDVSIIGSVGVLSWPPYFNVTDPMKKWEIESLTLSAGKGKDKLNPFRPWKEGESDNMQSLLNYFYKQFVDIVIEARPSLGEENLVETYGARVFPAPLAKERGYIDLAGSSRSEALRALAAAADIPEDVKYQVIEVETKSWWRKVIRQQQQSPLFSGRLRHEVALPYGLSNEPSVMYLHR